MFETINLFKLMNKNHCLSISVTIIISSLLILQLPQMAFSNYILHFGFI